ncbi:MAG TPA: hypothetical protein VLG67_02255 [Candidatus Saccharimonadales bacterium]|nr:hypothetical protein [Candidatus Saccharimonadales bacterium]
MKFLVGFSILIEKFKNPKDEQINTQSVDYIAPPVLNPLPNATKNDKTAVSGFASSSNATIILYVNGELADKTRSKSDNSFTFENVSLNSGDNEIKAKTEENEDKQSDFSQSITITFLNKPPALDITFPHDGQSFKKDESPIKISGKSDKGVKVTVNSFWAISQDDGSFYYQYNLKDGDNDLKFAATDDAGNKTEKELHIKVN